jgi:N-methylhydantoinase A
VALGYLVPDAFLGGEMELDAGAASDALARDVASALDVEVSRAAWGVHEVINEDVARAFRVHASEIGFDYRRCAMVAFGGSGPAHAMRVARKLRIPKVIFPVGAGVMSAIGLLTVPISFATLRSGDVRLETIDAAGLEAGFAPVERQARSLLEAAGVPLDGITLERRLDMRFYGQGHEVEVTLPDGTSPARLGELFLAAYAEAFAVTPLDAGIEIVNWKIEANGPNPDFAERYHPFAGPSGGDPVARRVRIFDPTSDDYVECPVYDRYALPAGTTIEGPALIQENEATTVLGTGERLEVDSFGNLVATFADGES